MFNKKDLKFEIAEQEAIKFNYALIELFIVKILNIEPGFFISDDSSVSDMRTYPSSKCKQLSENEWEFTQTYYKRDPNLKKSFHQLTEEEKERLKRVFVHKLKKEEVSFDEDLIQQTKDLFGVTITSQDLSGSFVDLGLKLGQGVTPERRVELIKLHSQIE